jgi:hypothetical protein
MTEDKSYVYENTEVIMTGRSATKELRSGKIDTLYEITPKHSTSGQWKKWVNFSDLFEVSE